MSKHRAPVSRFPAWEASGLSKDHLWDLITHRELDATSAAVVRELFLDPDVWPTTTTGLDAERAADALHALAEWFQSGGRHLHEGGMLACICPNQ